MSAVTPFRTLGYHVFPRIIPASCFNALRQAVPKAVHARGAAFLTIPSPSDVLTQEVRQEDPMVSSLRRKFAEHGEQRKRRRMLMKRRRLIEFKKRKLLIEKRRAAIAAGDVPPSSSLSSSSSSRPPPSPAAVKRNPSLASASDISTMSQRITEQLASLNPSQSSIENDPQRLQAINQHSCNLWMTDPALAKLVHGEEFGKRVLGKIAREVGGVESPVLFGDRPVFQLPFGRPTLMHFAAPFLGVDQVRGCNCSETQKPNALAIWVPLSPSVSIRVFERSHAVVEPRMRAEPKKLDPRLFRVDFRAVDSNTTLWARRFPELLGLDDADATAEPKRAVELTNLPPGSAVAFDPYTFAAVAPNVTLEEQAVMEFLIISSAPGSITPSVHPYTWIREWKSSSLQVDFKNKVVFPELF